MNRTCGPGVVGEEESPVDEYSPSKTTAEHSHRKTQKLLPLHSNNAHRLISAGMVYSAKRSGK
jgi:hypothetical protein